MNTIRKMIYQAERKIELLHHDTYEGYKYYILNLGTHPTAYVAIPKGNILYKMDYDTIYKTNYDINVHGGLTYSSHTLMGIESKDWFIGWDYAHYDDYAGYYADTSYLSDDYLSGKRWTTEEIIEECKQAINDIIKISKGE